MRKWLQRQAVRLLGISIVGAVGLRPGDVLILQTRDRMSQAAIERFRAQWRDTFDDRFPVALLPGDWTVYVAREAIEREAR